MHTCMVACVLCSLYSGSGPAVFISLLSSTLLCLVCVLLFAWFLCCCYAVWLFICITRLQVMVRVVDRRHVRMRIAFRLLVICEFRDGVLAKLRSG